MIAVKKCMIAMGSMVLGWKNFVVTTDRRFTDECVEFYSTSCKPVKEFVNSQPERA